MHCKDLVHSRCLLDEWLWVSRWMVYGLYSISPFIKPKYLIWSLRVLLAGVFYVWEREEARHPRHLAPQSAKVTATASWITISHTHLASAGIITQGQKAWQSPVTVLSGVLCGERHGDLTDESIKIMPKAFSESDYGDGFKEHVYCSRSAALGIILGTYQMCLMSLCSCNKLRGKSHTSGWKAIDCLRGGGGVEEAQVMVISWLLLVLQLWREGNESCITWEKGVMLCGVIWVANSCFKA